MHFFSHEIVGAIGNHFSILSYDIESHWQTKMHNRTAAAKAAATTARNFRRSLKMPMTPNTAAAKNDAYITSSTRARNGLPQPGESTTVIPAVRADMTRQTIATSPKQQRLAR